jgi:hypothetical protein
LILLVDRNDTHSLIAAMVVDCSLIEMRGLSKKGTPRRLAAAFRESAGGGGGTNRTILGPKKGTWWRKNETRAGGTNNPPRVEIARGSKNATRARAHQQPTPAGEGLANP